MKNKSTCQMYKRFIVDISNYKIIQKINSGGFGAVYSVEQNKTGEKFAAKVLSDHKDESKYKLMINREIGIMIRCNHPTIINLIGYSFKDFHGENNITIIMELAKKGSLAELLKKSQNGLADDILDNTIRQIILIGIARGMMYLHEHKIIHRDLKPGNILLDEDFHPHITDFGLSKLSENSSSISQSQQCGTTAYMAPEVIEGNKYSGKADVYAFGILMYEVITDLTPYPELTKGKFTIFKFNNMVINENHRPIFKFPIKKSLQKLIERCWSKNPNERPTFECLFKKLAYNIEDEVDDIYDESNYLNEEGGEVEDEDNKYYLEGVDIDEIASYIDDIDFQEIQTNKAEPAQNETNLENQKLMTHIRKLEDSIESMKEQYNQLQIENKQQKALFDDVVKNQIGSIKKENEELKKQINDLRNENTDQKNKFDNEISKQLNLIIAENKQIKKENEEMKEKISLLERKSDINNQILLKDDSIKPPPEKVNKRLADKDSKEKTKSIKESSSKEKVDSSLINKDSIEKTKSIKEPSSPSKKAEREHNILSKEKVDLSLIDKDSKEKTKSIKDPSSKEKVDKKLTDKPPSKEEKRITIDAKRITINSFNELSLQLQKNVISQLDLVRNNFFKKIDDLLDYMLNYCPPGSKNHFKINNVNKSAILSNMQTEDKIFLLHPAIEILNKKNAFNTPRFVNLLLQFIQIVIELKYPCKHFDEYYRNINNIQNNKAIGIDFRIFISSIDKTDDKFRNNSDINSVTFDSSVSKIESKNIDNVYYGSFSNCSSLKSITIPYSIGSIGPFSFDKCTSLQEISIPSSIKEIPQYAFRGCTSLQKVELSFYLNRIGMSAFSGCSALTSIEIPDNIKVIERNTFNGCSSLVQIKIPPNVTKIEASAFSGCSALTRIDIHNGVTMIEASAFKGCKSLSEFVIPELINEIQKSTFFGCSALMEISIPKSVKSIGFGAFTDCTSLEEITIPPSVTEIGDFCFKNCSKLSTIIIDKSKTKIAKNAFKDCVLLQPKH